ncbi:YaiI/YqxD family protein, partial [Staphylococcus epidermidis]
QGDRHKGPQPFTKNDRLKFEQTYTNVIKQL